MSFISQLYRLLIIGLIFSASIVNLWALPTQKFTRYTAENGLDAFITQTMFQDFYGCLWFGTWNGLYSFDGNTFQRAGEHGDIEKIDNPRINQLAPHPDGSIWFITYDGLVYRFSSISGQYTQITTSEHHVRRFEIMPDGIVWMVSDRQELLMGQGSGADNPVEVVDFFKQQSLRQPSRINDLVCDPNGNHWIMTEEGAYCYQPKDKQLSLITPTSAYELVFTDEYGYFGGRIGKLYRCNYTSLQFDEIQLGTGSSIKKIYQMPNGSLLLLTASDGFFFYDPITGQSQHFTTANVPGLGDNTVRDAFVDHLGELWLRTNQPGIVHYVPATGACRRHILHDDQGVPLTEASTEQTVVEDVYHRLWVHPSGGGLGWYDRDKDELVIFYNPNLAHRWNNTTPLQMLFSDQQGNLWFCTHANGLEKASFMQYPFILENVDSQNAGRACNNVRAIHQMRDGRIWAGCRDRVVRVFSSDYQFVGNLCKDGKLRKDRSDIFSQVYDFIEADDGTIWMGSKGEGLFMLKPNGPDSYSIRQFKTSSQDTYSLGSNAVYDLYIDHKGRLWIATFENGVNILDYDEEGKNFRFYNTHNELTSYPLMSCGRARCIEGDDQGNIFIGTTGGLLVCNDDFATPSALRFRHYHPVPDVETSLPASDITSICISPSTGRTFVATFGAGVCEFARNGEGGYNFNRVTDPTGKKLNDIVYSLVEDINGTLWAVQEDAITHVFRDSLFERFSDVLLPTRLAFNEGHPAQLMSGELMIPSLQGAMRFHPDSLMHSGFVPNICIRNDSILLPPDNHDCIIQFSALDFVLPEVIQYAYRLVGYDNEWHYVGNHHAASYTNLPPGKYTFEVRSTNHSGIWVDNTRRMPLEVQPTFGQTTLARFLRILFIVLMVLLVVGVVLWILKLHQKVRVEEQLTDQKLKLYTNLSHELRTPLTLIVGPLEQMRRRQDLPPSLSQQLDIVSSNATHMLRTVNQMLDFRKIEKGKMHLVVQQVDLVAFAEQHVRNFTLLSESMNIPLHFDTDLSRLDIWADPEKLEHIINNLIGNAFKYSKSGHPIYISVAQVDGKAQLTVRDEGIGIAQDKLMSIYERFNSTSGNTPSGMASSGIGLSLTRELVRLHSGEIEVKSQLGAGTTFVVTLPLGRDHFTAETEFVSGEVGQQDAPEAPEVALAANVPDSVPVRADAVSDASVVSVGSNTPVAPTPANEPPSSTETTEEDQNAILVVEDNKELRKFICQIFEGRYKIYEASDGREGLRMAEQKVPDVVISDVMMPLMDGFQMVQQIRQHPQICHLSVIMLTALSDTETKLKGLNLGIDSYITKPFEASYLLARVDNILRKRELLQRYFKQQLADNAGDAQKSAETVTKEQLLHAPLSSDQRFVTKVIADMKANLNNADYSVDDMASAANMSRSTFGRKFRALMGMVPTDMLRDLRLQRAAELIRTSDLNVSQVAYEVGFADPHYFGKCFKAYYQMTPSEYKANPK